MKRVTIKIETINAAFDDMPLLEVARILRIIADDMDMGGRPPAALHDLNGNACGSVTIV
jgi:hypothetical protein